LYLASEKLLPGQSSEVCFNPTGDPHNFRGNDFRWWPNRRNMSVWLHRFLDDRSAFGFSAKNFAYKVRYCIYARRLASALPSVLSDMHDDLAI
jgi:hypothetical protein